MKSVDLDALRAADIPRILDAVNLYLRQNGLALVTDNIFLKPEMLSKRWELTLSCLNNWRFTGEGPVYMKTGSGPKARVRYPLLGTNGIMAFEQERMFTSTTQEAARQSQVNQPA